MSRGRGKRADACGAFAAALLLGAARGALAGDRPGWISGDSPAYPKSVYITGVGEADTQEKAADRARAEVAKSLSLSVSANTSVSARETSNGSVSSFFQEVSDDVRTSTAKVLDGVEIAQYWKDDAGTHYALAVLNRGRGLAVLKDKIDEYDRNFRDWTGELSKADGKFARLKAALKLVESAKSRRKLNGDYRALNPDGKGLPPPEAFNDAQAQARKAAAALTISVAASGQKAEAVSARIIDLLSGRGLRAVEKGGGAADIVVEAEARGRPMPMENLTWFWAKGAILVKMSYGATGEVFTRFTESGQESAHAPGSAVDAVLFGLADKTAGHVYKALLSSQLSDD